MQHGKDVVGDALDAVGLERNPDQSGGVMTFQISEVRFCATVYAEFMALRTTICQVLCQSFKATVLGWNTNRTNDMDIHGLFMGRISQSLKDFIWTKKQRNGELQAFLQLFIGQKVVSVTAQVEIINPNTEQSAFVSK